MARQSSNELPGYECNCIAQGHDHESGKCTRFGLSMFGSSCNECRYWAFAPEKEQEPVTVMEAQKFAALPPPAEREPHDQLVSYLAGPVVGMAAEDLIRRGFVIANADEERGNLALSVAILAEGVDVIHVMPGWDKDRQALLETFVGAGLLGLKVVDYQSMAFVPSIQLIVAWGDLMVKKD